MKKRSLIFGVVVLIGAALIFSGCESPTDGAAGAPGKGFGVFTGATSAAAIQAAVDSGAEVYLDGVTIGVGTLDLKTATVRVFGTLASDDTTTGTTDVFVIADKANLIFDEDAELDFASGDFFIGTTAQLAKAKTGSSGNYTEPATSIEGVESGDVVALLNLTLPASYTSFAGTAYVYGTLTVAADSSAPSSGKIVAIRTVALTGAEGTTTPLSDASKVDVSGATIVWDGAARDVTLPATVAGPTFNVTGGQGVLTVKGTTSLTAQLTGSGFLSLPTVATATITGDGLIRFPGTGDPLAQTFSGTFDSSIEASVIDFPVGFTASKPITLGGELIIPGGKTLTFTAATDILTLKSGSTIKTGTGTAAILSAGADAELTPVASAVLTVSAATDSTPAKLALGTAGLELTSGTLTVAEGAELALGEKLTVKGTLNVAGTLSGAFSDVEVSGASAVLKTTGDGKLVVGSGTDTATLSKATFTEESSKPVLTLANGGAITTAGSGELEFGATTFSGDGAWTASVSADDGDNITGVKITIDTAGATIAAAAPSGVTAAGTATLTASGIPVITQAAEASNALTIGANTVIALGGTDTAAAGQIVLTGHAANPGKIALVATTSVVKTGNAAGTGAFASAAKIGSKTFGTSTADITTTADAATGKLATVTASAANKDLVGGDASNTITIDSTQDVTT
jgi:hypothetical protein